MKRTTIWLTEEQLKSLNKISDKTGARIAALIRKAVDEFVKKHK